MAEKKTVKKRNVLGRGLDALLDDSSKTSGEGFGSRPILSASVGEIHVDKIDGNPYQPRTTFEKEALNELADSIKVHGIIQPITVRKMGSKYQLITGERRLQASRIAGKKSLPAYVRTANDQQMLEMALIENIQRENLNAIEIALSYQRLISDCNLKQEELGDRVSKNRTTVTNYLRLLKLPPDIQIAVRDNRISMGHARAIVNVETIDLQLDIFHKIIKDDLSVRKTEALVRDYTIGSPKSPQPVDKSKKEPPAEIVKLQKDLSSHFGSKVVVRSDKSSKGEIRIPFISVEDLNRILDILEFN